MSNKKQSAAELLLPLNQLYRGDCLDFLYSLPDACADALITDPPYSSGGLHIGARQRSTSEKYQLTQTKKQYADFQGDHRDQRGHLAWCVLWLSQCHRILKTGAPICLFSDWRQVPITTDALQAAGFTWRGITVWDKTEMGRPSMGRFRAQAEYVVWGSKGPMPQDRGVGVLPGVYRHPIHPKDKLHLTGKPVPLMADLVKICAPGGTILEPFAGSGTTLVAAEAGGFNWLASELSPDYAAVTEARLSGQS